MSANVFPEDKFCLENNLKRELLKACCKVFQLRNGYELTILGCVAVTIQSKKGIEPPLLYFAHVNQILSEENYNSYAEVDASQNDTNKNINTGTSPMPINTKIKQERDDPVPPTSFLNVLPAEMIPLGKGFVVKTQTVYEKTADGEERKVSVSTQGLIDTCDLKAFAGQSEAEGVFKQEVDENNFQNGTYYDDGNYNADAYVDANGNATYTNEYGQFYPAESENYYAEDPIPPQPQQAHPRPTRRPTKFAQPKTMNQPKKRNIPNVKKPRHPQMFNTARNCTTTNNVNHLHNNTYNYQQQQQKPKDSRGSNINVRSFGGKLGRAVHDPSNPYVVTRSMHECGYPGCGKRFKWKQHLLRHQTEKHGRVPSKKLAFEKVLVRNPNYQRQVNNNFCNTVDDEDTSDAYYNEDVGDDLSYDDCDDGQEYYY